jgi:serine/threonine protein kinase
MVDGTIKKLNLSEYNQGATLGTGSFGRVRIAKHNKTGNYVAVKCMKKMEIIKSKQTDHIMNEIKILGSISHPFVITFDGFSQDDKFTYLRGIGKFGVEQSM